MSKAKPFSISKKSVMAAWERVKANKGSYGVDEESIQDFERNLNSLSNKEIQKTQRPQKEGKVLFGPDSTA